MGAARKVMTALAVLAAVLSCTGKDPGPVTMAEVSFEAGTLTRSGPEDREVGTLDVLVFRDDGSLEAHGRSEGGTLRMRLPEGVRLRWHAAANVPPGILDNASSERQMPGGSSTLEHSLTGGAVMTASGEITLTGSATVEVELRRLASKVTIGRVIPSWMDGEEHGEVRLRGVYLTNACGSCPYTGIPEAGDWLNVMGWDGTLAEPVRSSLGVFPDRVLDGSAAEIGASLLTCPNPTGGDTDFLSAPQWSPRPTRLVLEVTEDGRSEYYPITLPPMECNTEYIIREARLIGHGSDHPDKPARRAGISVGITVRAWGSEEHTVTVE